MTVMKTYTKIIGKVIRKSAPEIGKFVQLFFEAGLCAYPVYNNLNVDSWSGGYATWSH